MSRTGNEARREQDDARRGRAGASGDLRGVTRREAIAGGAAVVAAAMLGEVPAAANLVIPHPVVPATTNFTAVIGAFPRGPVRKATLVRSWPEFVAEFGALEDFGSRPSMAAFAVYQFFLGGGIGAWIVRLDAPESAVAQVTIDPLLLRVAGGGAWADDLLVDVQPSKGAVQLAGAAPATPNLVDLSVTRRDPDGQAAVREVMSALPADGGAALASAINARSFYVTAAAPTSTVGPDSQPFAGSTVTVGGLTLTTPAAWARDAALTATITASAQGGGLVDLTLTSASTTPLETLPGLKNDGTPAALAATVTSMCQYVSAAPQGTGPLRPQVQSLSGGADGSWSVDSFTSAVLAEVGEPDSPSAPEPALDQIGPQVFNLMCIPDVVYLSTAAQGSVVAAAHRFCRARQAFLLVDPPPPAAAMPAAWLPGALATPVDAVGTAAGMASLEDWMEQVVSLQHGAAAGYYPWVSIADPTNNFTPRFVPPSGSVAGVYATTDTNRNVWKAPAGTAAALLGVARLADQTLDDTVNADLNTKGLNCLRTFATAGTVVWGARTLAGADLDTAPFKYVSTARLTFFIEQSLQQSMKWAVFEPNGLSLWSVLASEANTFMAGLFAQGAFGGATAAQAYQVTCDATTTSVTDMQQGIVNVGIAFATGPPAQVMNVTIRVSAASPS